MPSIAHPDPDINAALIGLLGALCMFERGTGRRSLLILHDDDFHMQALDGKPYTPYIGESDEELLFDFRGR